MKRNSMKRNCMNQNISMSIPCPIDLQLAKKYLSYLFFLTLFPIENKPKRRRLLVESEPKPCCPWTISWLAFEYVSKISQRPFCSWNASWVPRNSACSTGTLSFAHPAKHDSTLSFGLKCDPLFQTDNTLVTPKNTLIPPTTPSLKIYLS